MTARSAPEEPDVLWDGFIAGSLGGIVVALWFLVLDLAQGHPLHTPALLGTAIFEGPEAASRLERIHTDVVAMYSGVHMGLFAIFGITLAWLVRQFRRTPVLGYLLVFLLVFFEFGFYVFVLAFADPVVEGLPGWSILAGNLMAAVVMAGYFLIRNPDLLKREGSRDAGRGAGGPR